MADDENTNETNNGRSKVTKLLLVGMGSRSEVVSRAAAFAAGRGSPRRHDVSAMEITSVVELLLIETGLGEPTGV